MNNMNDKQFFLGSSYVAIEKLGKGSYGSVYRVIHSETKQEYAIKIMVNNYPSEGVPRYAIRELSILKKLKHPHIIHVYDYSIRKTYIELRLDYCQYDLYAFKYLYFNDRLHYNEQTIKKIMYQLIQGINYLHSNLIMHRDLKPQNILLDYIDGEPIVKITDFGMSRRYTIPNKAYSMDILTLNYRAPEVILGQTSYSIAIDMWSLGCICVELFINTGLFNCKSDLELLDNQFKIFGTFDENIFPGVTSLPLYNPNFKQYKPSGIRSVIEEHSNFNVNDSLVDLINQFLQVDPSKRSTCKDALLHVIQKKMISDKEMNDIEILIKNIKNEEVKKEIAIYQEIISSQLKEYNQLQNESKKLEKSYAQLSNSKYKVIEDLIGQKSQIGIYKQQIEMKQNYLTLLIKTENENVQKRNNRTEKIIQFMNQISVKENNINQLIKKVSIEKDMIPLLQNSKETEFYLKEVLS